MPKINEILIYSVCIFKRLDAAVVTAAHPLSKGRPNTAGSKINMQVCTEIFYKYSKYFVV